MTSLPAQHTHLTVDIAAIAIEGSAAIITTTRPDAVLVGAGTMNKSSAVADKRRHGCVRLFVICSTVMIQFVSYKTDSKSSGYYSTVESTFKYSVTTKTQLTYESINQFLETKSSVIAERPCNVHRQL